MTNSRLDDIKRIINDNSLNTTEKVEELATIINISAKDLTRKTDTALKSFNRSIDSIEDKDVNIIAAVRKFKPKEVFVFLFPKSLRAAMHEHNLQVKDLDVLFRLAETMEYGNSISITQKELAAEVNSSQPVVSRCLKKLQNAGIITKKDSTITINWHYLAKGSLNKFDEKEKQIKQFKHVSASGRTTTEIAVSDSGINVHINQIHSDEVPF